MACVCTHAHPTYGMGRYDHPRQESYRIINLIVWCVLNWCQLQRRFQVSTSQLWYAHVTRRRPLTWQHYLLWWARCQHACLLAGPAELRWLPLWQASWLPDYSTMWENISFTFTFFVFQCSVWTNSALTSVDKCVYWMRSLAESF